MFSIQIQLCNQEISGLKLLDLNRRLQLPDDTVLASPRHIVEAEVTEAFARQHMCFRNSFSGGCRIVPYALLVPGDLALVDLPPADNRTTARLAPGDEICGAVTPETPEAIIASPAGFVPRVVELWLACPAGPYDDDDFEGEDEPRAIMPPKKGVPARR